MVAVQVASQKGNVGRGCRGCLLFALLPFFILGLFVVAVVSDSDEAEAASLRGVACAPAGASATHLGVYGPEQMRNAGIIVGVGRGRGIPEQGQVIALMAAMTESGLRNLDYGDRDSLGLFQMRPSMGWGTSAQLTDPTYAANKFYDVLLNVAGWQTMAPGAAAQAVERSAYPDRYAKYEQTAREILGAVGGVRCPPRIGGTGQRTSLPDNPKAETVINAALSQVGKPYSWAGGDASGPTMGTDGILGFDCSGLALYAYAQIGVAVPHQTQAIWAAFQPAITDRGALRPGDLILFSNNGRPGGIHHVGIYLGDGRMVHAPERGDVVRVAEQIWESPFWSKEFIGGVRPGVA